MATEYEDKRVTLSGGEHFAKKYSLNIVEILICGSDVLIVRCPEGARKDQSGFLSKRGKVTTSTRGEK